MMVNALIPFLIFYAIILGFDIVLEVSEHYKKRGLHILYFFPEKIASEWQILCTALTYLAFGAWIYQDGLLGGLYLPELCALQFMIHALYRMYKLLKPVEMNPDASQS